MTRYVCGFAFNAPRTEVLLIHKKKPDWQAGRLNGIGGKIEAGEQSIGAMVREFREETSIGTVPSQWVHYLTLSGRDGSYEVEMFSGLLAGLTLLEFHGRRVEDEPLFVATLDRLHWLAESGLAIPNLAYLVPLASLQWRQDCIPEHGEMREWAA